MGLSKQRKSGLEWYEFLCSFVVKVPLCNLRPSIIYSVHCERIVQRAYFIRPDFYQFSFYFTPLILQVIQQFHLISFVRVFKLRVDCACYRVRCWPWQCITCIFIFLVSVKQVRHQATCLADIIASSLVPRDRGNEVELHLQSDLLLSRPFSIKRMRSPFRLYN